MDQVSSSTNKARSPICISIQPGHHLCVDSRPCSLNELCSDEFRDDYYEQFSRPATHYVSSPFKQGRRPSPLRNAKMVDPGGGLKQATKLSLEDTKNSFQIFMHTFDDINMTNKSFHTRKKQGRLLPLLGAPVIRGPKVNQCIGIMPGIYNQSNKPRRVRSKRNGSRLHRELSIHRNSFNSIEDEKTDDSSSYGNDDVISSHENGDDEELIERVSRLNFVKY